MKVEKGRDKEKRKMESSWRILVREGTKEVKREHVGEECGNEKKKAKQKEIKEDGNKLRIC